MTYQEYTTYMKVCDYLGKEPEGRFGMIHEFMVTFWEDMELCFIEKEPRHQIILHKDYKYRIIIDIDWKEVYCHNQHLWRFFSDSVGMNFPEIQEFVKQMLEERLDTTLKMIVTDSLLTEKHVNNYLKSFKR
jgi:hypothetical protein